MNKWLVGIPTYKRPASLEKTLDSLATQYEAPRFDVCIVDNDPAQSAKGIAEGFLGGLAITYLTEPRPGVVHVRNRLLQQASTYKSLAFLDDDEIAGPMWLFELSKAMDAYPGSIISGRVDYELETTQRNPELALLTFKRPNREPGDLLLTTGTGNSAIPIQLLPPNGRALRFDPRYAMIGGEDTHYYAELSKLGVQIRSWPAAAVQEIVPQDRTSREALKKRLRRSGHVNAMLALETRSRWRIAAAYGLRLCLGVPASFLASGKQRRARAIALTQSGLGGLDSLFSPAKRYYGEN